MSGIVNCRACNAELTDDNWYASLRTRNQRVCKACSRSYSVEWGKNNKDKKQKWKENNPIKVHDSHIRYSRKIGKMPMNERKECGAYLGVFVAEQVLYNVFKNVERMPYNNHGYDFICNRGKKIDVKASCKTNRGGWSFHIDRNDIADFFLCLAFDNRTDLTPLNLWLIPSTEVSYKLSISIKDVNKNKWTAYQLNIDKVAACCTELRS